MFHILLLIFYLFRDMKSNLSGSLWGLPDRRKAGLIKKEPAYIKANAELKACVPICRN